MCKEPIVKEASRTMVGINLWLYVGVSCVLIESRHAMQGHAVGLKRTLHLVAHKSHWWT